MSETSNRPRVLFVDDEPLLTRLGEEFLKRLGYEAVTATCPEAAIEKFKAGTFDLVITDLTMPKMSGIEMARVIQKLRPEVPIVLSTAFQQKLGGKNPADFGFKSLLVKPYNLKTMGDALKLALSSTRAD